MALDLRRIAFSLSESLNYYMSYINELHEPNYHLLIYIGNPPWVRYTFIQFLKKNDFLCIFKDISEQTLGI